MEEYFDELNEKGDYTGHVVSRQEAHETGIYHKAVALFIINDKDEVLLQKRSSTKKLWPNMWDISAGGHVLTEEFGYQAIIRETKEELGIELPIGNIIFLGSSISTNLGENIINNHFNEYYIAKLNVDIKNIKIDKSEVQDVKWVKKEEIIDKINNNYEELTNKVECYNYLLKYYKWQNKNIN